MPKVYQKTGLLSAKKRTTLAGRPRFKKDKKLRDYSGFRSHHSIRAPVATKIEL